MQTRGIAWWIGMVAWCLAACQGSERVSDCDPACAAGSTCVDGDCVVVCNRTSECPPQHECTSGRCVFSGCVEDAECDDGDVCTVDLCGAAGCSHVATTGPCDDSDPCTANDVCDGGVCAGTVSACDDGNPCTTDTCDALGECGHDSAPSGTICREAAGPCDIQEVCDGIGTDCPTDTLALEDTVCRPANGLCDVEGRCDGRGALCPFHGFLEAGTVCRRKDGPCDVAETCDGKTPSCPADAYVAAATTVCRSNAGPCDVEEICDGTSASCPEDRVAASGTECRASTGLCDPAETCDGTTVGCPNDRGFAVNGYDTGTSCYPGAGSGTEPACCFPLDPDCWAMPASTDLVPGVYYSGTDVSSWWYQGYGWACVAADGYPVWRSTVGTISVPPNTRLTVEMTSNNDAAIGLMGGVGNCNNDSTDYCGAFVNDFPAGTGNWEVIHHFNPLNGPAETFSAVFAVAALAPTPDQTTYTIHVLEETYSPLREEYPEFGRHTCFDPLPASPPSRGLHLWSIPEAGTMGDNTMSVLDNSQYCPEISTTLSNGPELFVPVSPSPSIRVVSAECWGPLGERVVAYSPTLYFTSGCSPDECVAAGSDYPTLSSPPVDQAPPLYLVIDSDPDRPETRCTGTILLSIVL